MKLITQLLGYLDDREAAIIADTFPALKDDLQIDAAQNVRPKYAKQ